MNITTWQSSLSLRSLLAQAEPFEQPGPPGEPIKPRPPNRPSLTRTLAVTAFVIVAGILAWNERATFINLPPGLAAMPPTAQAVVGDFERRLRVTGTVAARIFAPIRVPTMWGGRDVGRDSNALTLTKLAEPGSRVNPGAAVASFEFEFIEDHLSDIQSRVLQSEADLQKLRAKRMISKAAEDQALREAKAARDKARLDLRTAEVRW